MEHHLFVNPDELNGVDWCKMCSPFKRWNIFNKEEPVHRTCPIFVQIFLPGLTHQDTQTLINGEILTTSYFIFTTSPEGFQIFIAFSSPEFYSLNTEKHSSSWRRIKLIMWKAWCVCVLRWETMWTWLTPPCTRGDDIREKSSLSDAIKACPHVHGSPSLTLCVHPAHNMN